ncbi:hypothetical protein PT974_07598 [Cladobotryum mycophilum]|uniref:BHLH domain-containing protein n=1 Tax=Cladobotryum mycophilum TaxID=491253 RepID=A0ABR0SQH2_9HYPO
MALDNICSKATAALNAANVERDCPSEQLVTEEQEASIRAGFHGSGEVKWRNLFLNVFPNVSDHVEQITPYLNYNMTQNCVALPPKLGNTPFSLTTAVPCLSTTTTDQPDAATPSAALPIIGSAEDIHGGDFDFTFSFSPTIDPHQNSGLQDPSNIPALFNPNPQLMDGQTAASISVDSNTRSNNPTSMQQVAAPLPAAPDRSTGHNDHRTLEVLQARSKRHRDNANDMRVRIEQVMPYMEKAREVQDQLYLKTIASSEHALVERLGDILDVMTEILQGKRLGDVRFEATIPSNSGDV